MIVFDQRGTGRSGPLRCRALEQANLLSAEDAAGRCATGLQSRRAFYTTSDSVEDVEAIRRELGIDRIALYGTSYGTKVALAYASRYPSHVERLALDSVVEAGGPDPLYSDTIAAVPRALRAVCRRACCLVHPRSGGRSRSAWWARCAAGTAAGPAGGRPGPDPAPGPSAAPTCSASSSPGTSIPALRAAFPGAVRAGLRGDAAPLLRLSRRAFTVDGDPPPPRILSAALYAATTCEETPFPWARNTPAGPGRRAAATPLLAVTARPDSAFLPFDRATVLDSDLLDAVRPLGRGERPAARRRARCPTCPSCSSRARTTCARRWRTPGAWPRCSPSLRLVVAPATGHSALGSDQSPCARAAPSIASSAAGRVPTRCGRVRRAFFRPASAAHRASPG